jgi:hypothetical protein
LLGQIVWINERKMDMKFGVLDVRGLYNAGSFMTVVKEISKYKLDLVAVQVRWDGVALNQQVNEYILFCGKGNECH